MKIIFSFFGTGAVVAVLSFLLIPFDVQATHQDGAYCEEFCELYDLEYGEFFYDDVEYLAARKTYTNNDDIYDKKLGEKLSGEILLQVEEHGEAYYVHPDNLLGFYLKDGEVAYQLMRQESLGISEVDFAKLEVRTDAETLRDEPSICRSNSFAGNLKGRVMLRPEAHGEAYYIDTETCLALYLEDGQAAYDSMRFLGLGISNKDLQRIPTQRIAAQDVAYSVLIVDFIKGSLRDCDQTEFVDLGNIQEFHCSKVFYDPRDFTALTARGETIVRTNYAENSIEIEKVSPLIIEEEEIGGQMYDDVPYAINATCEAFAYESALLSSFLSITLESIDESIDLLKPQQSKLNLLLQDDKFIPSVLSKRTITDSFGTKIASCTFPKIDLELFSTYGAELLTLDPYIDLIEFEVFMERDASKTGGFVLGDLLSGAENRALFDEWNLDNFLNNIFPYSEIPPWSDPENKSISSEYDYYKLLIEESL